MIKLKNVVREVHPASEQIKKFDLTPEARKWLPHIPPEYWVRIAEAMERAQESDNEFPYERPASSVGSFLNNSFHWPSDGLDSNIWSTLYRDLVYRERS
jgi:hypothetical protein